MVHKCSFPDCLSAGLYPEIPEGSQLDFSALKEEVPLYLFHLIKSIFVLTATLEWWTYHAVSVLWQGEWLLLFNYLIPFSELLDQLGQALDSDSGGARLNIKTEQVGKRSVVCIKLKLLRCFCNSNVFVFLRSVNSLCHSVKTSARTTTESMCWGWGCVFTYLCVFPFGKLGSLHCITSWMLYWKKTLSLCVWRERVHSVGCLLGTPS